MSFELLSQGYLDFGPKVVGPFRVKSDEDESFFFRVQMAFSWPMPLARGSPESPGEVELEVLDIFTEDPEEIVGIPRPHLVSRVHDASFVRVILIHSRKQT